MSSSAAPYRRVISRFVLPRLVAVLGAAHDLDTTSGKNRPDRVGDDRVVIGDDAGQAVLFRSFHFLPLSGSLQGRKVEPAESCVRRSSFTRSRERRARMPCFEVSAR